MSILSEPNSYTEFLLKDATLYVCLEKMPHSAFEEFFTEVSEVLLDCSISGPEAENNTLISRAILSLLALVNQPRIISIVVLMYMEVVFPQIDSKQPNPKTRLLSALCCLLIANKMYGKALRLSIIYDTIGISFSLRQLVEIEINVFSALSFSAIIPSERLARFLGVAFNYTSVDISPFLQIDLRLERLRFSSLFLGDTESRNAERDVNKYYLVASLENIFI